MAIPVIYQLLTMVLLMVVGVILNKKKFLTESNAKGLSIVLTRVAVPANMIVLMQRPFSHEISENLRRHVSHVLFGCSAVFHHRESYEDAVSRTGAILRRRCLQQRYLHGSAFDYGHVRGGWVDLLRGSHVHLQRVPVHRMFCALCHWQWKTQNSRQNAAGGVFESDLYFSSHWCILFRELHFPASAYL